MENKMIHLPVPEDFKLPEMYRVHQQFAPPLPIDVTRTMNLEWARLKDRLTLLPNARIAVCVGSRGLSNLTQIVRTVVTQLKEAGARPFITSAMGSHGKATVQGQREVLAQKGITQKLVGAPVEVTMDVVLMGEADGIPLYMDRLAHGADGMVLINRVKPHTDFTGPVESGIIKMLCIGLGNCKGATFYHKAALSRGFYDMIITAGRHLLKNTNFLFGVGLVENQDHKTCDICMATAKEMEAVEIRLLEKARKYLPRLPLDQIDLLIVDEMGKDISGAGLDPNVVGGKGSCIWSADRAWPKISRIFVRDLTRATQGNASGLGMVDVTTPKLTNKIDFQTTAINALAASCPEDCKLPMTLATEKQAVWAALSTIGPHTLEDLRMVHIKNTLEVNPLRVSKGCLPYLKGDPGIRIESKGCAIAFDDTGDMGASVLQTKCLDHQVKI